MNSARAFRAWAIIPAAGESRRMGRPKLLLPWAGATVLGATVTAFLAGGVDRVVVVVRAGDDELARLAVAVGAVVVTAEAPPDMKASLAAGMTAIVAADRPAVGDAWLVAPGDMPSLEPEVVAALLVAYKPACPQAVVPVYRERRGHPVLLPWSLADELLALPANAGLDALLRAHTPHELSLDRPAPQDIDTPDDYRAALARLDREGA